MKKLSATKHFVFFAAVWTGFVSAGFAQTHALSWDDLFAMARLSDPRPSPDGKWVLFARNEYSVEADKGNTDLMLMSADGKTVRHLTLNPASDSNGRWHPDGSAVFFLSARGGSSQIYRLALNGGEPEKVADLPVDVDGFELSPDGTQVAFWAGVFPDCRELSCTAKRLKEREERKVKAMTFDRLFIRHWDSWEDGRRNHVFVMGLSDRKPADLMGGMDQDSPTKPWGGNEEVAWSPDSKSVAFVSKPADGEAWRTNTEIYIAPAGATSAARNLTAENPAVDTSPVFSPDGRTLAYLAMDRTGYEADRLHIVLFDLRNGTRRHLTKDWDRSVDEMVWSRDGKTIYAKAVEQGRGRIWAVNADSGEAKALTGDGTNSALRLLPDGKLLFLREQLTLPKEIFSLDPVSKQLVQVSRVNAERLGPIRFGQAEEFWFQNDGRKLRGWIVKPADFKEGQTYPVAFLIHGGPQWSFRDGFSYRWNLQFYAGAGYVTVAIDPRGSTGYGQAFTDAIRGNWGPGPYSDLMAGLNAVLKKYSFADRNRMCALGASYGGYMVNWIAGQDHPFKCLVTHDGDFDTTSSYFNTEELWFPEWDMTGPPWEKRDVYEKNSPMRNVAKWKTPTLVIHGGRDFRVAETEGFSTFNALQRRGIESRLLYFPDENHWVLKPQNSKLWHKTVLEWLDRWTGVKR